MIRGALAIFERDIRKFARSPILLFMTLFFPMVYLIIFGNAVGGAIDHIPLGMTQEELFYRETSLYEASLVRLEESDTFDITVYWSEDVAKRDLAKGRVSAVAVFPAPEGIGRPVRLYIDSSEYLVPSVIETGFSGTIRAISPEVPFEINMIYGEIEYLQFFGVAVIVLAIFMTTMMGGGNTIIRDREMGIIEGYLVTPVKRSSIILGMIGSTTVKALLAALVILVVDVLVAGVVIRSIETLLLIIFVLFIISLGIASFVISFASRFENQMAYSSTIAFFNLLLFMTSGAFYPVLGMPEWLRWVAVINPEYYAVHALRCIILRGQGLGVVAIDLVVITLFSVAAITFGIGTFRRTLE